MGYIRPIAVDIGCATGDLGTQMVLGDDLYGEVVFLDGDVGIAPYSLHQTALNLGTSIVGMVQDAELRVSALTVQVEVSIGLTVEVHAPVHQFSDLLRGISHHLLHGLTV